jgi:hypothetical protein
MPLKLPARLRYFGFIQVGRRCGCPFIGLLLRLLAGDAISLLDSAD